MAWFRCYYQSVGGGIVCEGPIECADKNDAMMAAYRLAIEDYESFEGYHGIPDIGNIMNNKDEYGLSENASEDDCWDTYYEARESWIDYWVEEAKDENDIDEDYQ